ncbi:hypothetical protein JCM33374_g2689 [Metschnikowia sp. JCM 33374]|nr:hypothetical protein JCM33374_g2689 [Metschnikowia sp. JCM 33374]
MSATRVRFTKEELRSPDLQLPPRGSSPNPIKNGSFHWNLCPYVEGEERVINVSCSQCHKKFEMKWPINTSTLKSHFNNKHQNHFPKRMRFSDDFDVQRKRIQIDISDEREIEEDENTFNETEYNRLFIDMIAACNIPLTTAFSPEFTRILTLLKPDVPAITSVSLNSVLKPLYTREVKLLKARLLSSNSRVAVTVGEWHGENDDPWNFDSGVGIFSIALQYYNDEFELENYTIGFEPFTAGTSYSGNTLYDRLIKALSENGISKNRIVSLTTDTSRDMCSLLESYTEECENPYGSDYGGDIPCAKYVSELALEAFLHFTHFAESDKFFGDLWVDTKKEKEQPSPELKDLLNFTSCLHTDIRNIIHTIPQHNYLFKTFRSLVDAREHTTKSPPSLVEDSDGSWISTYKMVDSFLYHRKEIDELLKKAKSLPKEQQEQFELECDEITEVQWNNLSSVRDILQTFKKCLEKIDSLNGPKNTLSILYIHGFLKDLDKYIDSGFENTNPYIFKGLAQAKKVILEKYPIRDKDIAKMKTVYLMTALDPRFKLGLFKDLGFSDSVIDDIEKYFYQVYDRYKQEYQEEMKRKNNSAERAKESETTTLLESGGAGMSQISLHRDEVETYLSETREKHAANVIEFYKSRKSSFPIIYRMAKDFLAVSMKSTPAKKILSESPDADEGRIILPNTLRLLTILKSRDVFPKEGRTPRAGKDYD